MANTISHTIKNITYSISNAWTSVLYSTLLISGSQIAKNKWEKHFLIWLAEHDQNHIGLGIVGIDFDHIFWSITEFKNQKQFILSIAQNAIDEKAWTKLDFDTDEEILTELLNKWIDIFFNTQIDDIVRKDDFKWYNKPILSELDMKCPIHHVFLNRLGETEKIWQVSRCYL